MTYNKYLIKALCALTTLILTSTIGQVSHGEIIFEGYAQVLADSKPIGYVVQRYEHDHKKKELTSKYYIQTLPAFGGNRESLVARCTEKFQPLSYRYTDTGPNHVRTIEAHFQKNVMKGYISNGKNKKKFQKEFPQGTFLSTFLGYLMLGKGYRPGVKFTFSAISEEDAEAFNGEAYIKESTHKKGLKAFKIVNKFKGAQFISFVSLRGDVLQTHSPVQKISTQLTSFEVATKGHRLDKKNLNAIFGGIPTGTKNVYAQQPRSKVKTSALSPPQH